MNQAVEMYLADLAQQPDVLGIALFGSTARGDNRPDSDVDLFVLTSATERREVEIVGDTNIEIVYTTESGARAFAAKRIDSFLNMWRDAKILTDKDGGMARLREFAVDTEAAGKKELEEWQVHHAAFDFRDGLRSATALAVSDPATAEILLQRCVFKLLQFYFDLHSIWTPPPNMQMSWLRDNDSHTAQMFDRFYSADKQNERISIATGIAEHIVSRK